MLEWWNTPGLIEIGDIDVDIGALFLAFDDINVGEFNVGDINFNNLPPGEENGAALANLVEDDGALVEVGDINVDIGALFLAFDDINVGEFNVGDINFNDPPLLPVEENGAALANLVEHDGALVEVGDINVNVGLGFVAFDDINIGEFNVGDINFNDWFLAA